MSGEDGSRSSLREPREQPHGRGVSRSRELVSLPYRKEPRSRSEMRCTGQWARQQEEDRAREWRRSRTAEAEDTSVPGPASEPRTKAVGSLTEVLISSS